MIYPASDDEMNTEQKPKVNRLIEMKYPITWLIGAVSVVLAALFAQYITFLDYGRDIKSLTNTVNQLNAKTDTRDDRISAVIQETIQIKASQANLLDRLQRTESDLKDSRIEIGELRRNQRWMPK